VSLPFAVISLAVCYLFTRRVFRADLRPPQTEAARAELRHTVESFDEWALAPDLRAFWRAAIILVLTVLGFALSAPLGVGPDFVALAGGSLMLLFHGKHVEDTIRKVNWTVVLFFSGLFVIVGVVREVHLLERIAHGLTGLTGNSVPIAITLVTWFSGVSSAIVDNIPVAATMIPIVPSMEGIPKEPLWWSLILGANLGGNATPIGSISCVIALHALHKEAGITVGWTQFLKVGGSLMAIELLLGTLYLILYHGSGLMPLLTQSGS